MNARAFITGIACWLLCLTQAWAVQLELPRVALSGVPFEAKASGLTPQSNLTLRFFQQGRESLRLEQTADAQGSLTVEIRLATSGFTRYEWSAGDQRGEGSLRVLPAWWSLLPPLLAVALALLMRQVVLALVGGVWLGAWMVFGADPFTALLRVVDTYLLNAYADTNHLKIVGFTLLLGGMVGLITRSGGLKAIVRALSRFARTDRSTQASTFLMGLLIFFDDYANSLFVGTTMRPLCDRLRISREKLAYLIDTTAAPVANLALISTWIGFEVSVIAESFQASGVQMEPYWAFILSLPYRFYPIFALILLTLLIWQRRDFGSMYRAELRARTTGRVLGENASPLADYDSAELTPEAHVQGTLWSAILPLLAAVLGTLGGLFYTGYHGAGEPLQGWAGVRAILANADSYNSLLWGSVMGCGVAFVVVLAGGMKLARAFEAWLAGMRAMLLALLILGLAWSIGQICSDLHTARYLVQSLTGVLSPQWLPALTTLVAAGISFATGSSWATMSILMPLVIPLARSLTQGMGTEEQTFFLIASLSSVLAGATFGDHCSPISDTTVLSSIFAGSDHIDHVRTQIPYALTAGVVAWVIGDLATAFGLPVWLALPLGAAALLGIVRLLGKPVPPFMLEKQAGNPPHDS
ncbi:MAG: Na+/H+ antiporter NhaC family protein [Fimbriimonadales bacterium]|nr:Na+/H+ antiporter NhaC family protein [Fimbriimonadales bacterium]